MEAKPDTQRVIRDVGFRIAEIRRKKKLTQREIADRLEVTIPWVSRIERVGANLQIETMVRIAWALEVEPQELWEPPQGATIKRGRPKKS